MANTSTSSVHRKKVAKKSVSRVKVHQWWKDDMMLIILGGGALLML